MMAAFKKAAESEESRIEAKSSNNSSEPESSTVAVQEAIADESELISADENPVAELEPHTTTADEIPDTDPDITVEQIPTADDVDEKEDSG